MIHPQAGYTKEVAGSRSKNEQYFKGRNSSHFIRNTDMFQNNYDLMQYSDVTVSATTNKLRTHGYIRFFDLANYSSFHFSP